jgi:hypothetical protein
MSEQCTGELVFQRREGGKAVYKCRLCGYEEFREIEQPSTPTASTSYIPTRDWSVPLIEVANLGKAPDAAHEDPGYRAYIGWLDPLDPLGAGSCRTINGGGRATA